MEEKKTIDIREVGIDEDVLEQITKDDVNKIIKDPKLLNRAILNCFAECLSEIKKVTKILNQFNQTISIVSQEKLLDYFGELDKNIKQEEKRLTTQKIIKESHKKSKK